MIWKDFLAGVVVGAFLHIPLIYLDAWLKVREEENRHFLNEKDKKEKGQEE